ncbi:hypothetical protein FCM35_KLT20396 [Carex littledalei]|uniref:Uncharacterized protein n=1 Tax=Carex littledalei TaxID=544730 RepID=A0A833R5Z9_9POAL|nr:hypothetical protein FCM35_KLT20396 [Carex littledalei]
MEPDQLPHPGYAVFLSPLDEHHRLLMNLNNSIVFQPTRPIAPSLSNLQQLLASRYGGVLNNWSIRRVANSFLVRIPEWVFSDDPYLDEDFWALHHLVVLPWQTLDGSEPGNSGHRIMVTIYDFPLDFWHPIYFRQATVGMGRMLGFATDAMSTANMSRKMDFVYLETL